MKHTAKILKCTCQHDYQDKIHGKNLRVMNMTTKNKSAGMDTYRCTICLREQTVENK